MTTRTARTLARLHREAAGALGTYGSRSKDEEVVAERNLTTSTAFAELLNQLATPPRSAATRTAWGRVRGTINGRRE